MANSSAAVLEFGLLRDLLRGYAASDLGRARVAALSPSIDLAWIQNQHQLTSEVREFRRVGGNFEFAGLSDITRLLEKSRIEGAALETLEVRDVLTAVDRAAEWREIAFHPPQGMKTDWMAVRQLSSGITDFSDLLRGIRNKILPDGTLDDKASPELASIPRWVRCQSEATPSLALYWHIGATTMRLAKVSWRNRIGVKRPSGIAGSIQAKECLTLPTLVGGANPFAAGPRRAFPQRGGF